jgi:multidrug efflux pump subunit AcrA (membrane-fusion protein)
MARVTSIFPASDPTTRTSIVEAIIDNADYRLFPGDAVTMKLLGEERLGVLTVPNSAIVMRTVPREGPSSGQEPTVWLATGGQKAPDAKPVYTCVMHPEVRSDKPGKCPKCGMDLVPEKTSVGGAVKTAHQVLVTLGPSDGERTVILSGLREGDAAIVRGHENLHEGDAVYAVPWGDRGPLELPPAPMIGSGEGTGSNDEGSHPSNH